MWRSWLPIALLVLIGCPLATGQPVIVFVGSGACDGDDHDCTDDKTAEQVVTTIEVYETGEMAPRPELSLNASGLPVWFATARISRLVHSMSRDCTFVTRADRNDILPIINGRTLGKAVPSGGVAPVFAAVTADLRTLLVANYHGPDDSNTSTGASAASFSIGEDCSLTFVDAKPHKGSSVNPARQGGAHVHSFVPVRDEIAYACDLGMDLIFTYSVGSDGKLVELHRTPTEPGSGPRHLVQHPSAPIVYVVHEMGQIVTAWEQQAHGQLKLLQTMQLPAAPDHGSKAAEIAISPDGAALYATNRMGVNTVTTFKIHLNGTLQSMGQVQAPKIPRGMTLAFDGAMMLVAGQHGSEVESFHVVNGGDLVPTGHTLKTGLPPHPAAFAVQPRARPHSLVVV